MLSQVSYRRLGTAARRQVLRPGAKLLLAAGLGIGAWAIMLGLAWLMAWTWEALSS